MINRVVLVGRLTKDIELRFTQNEKAVGNFSLAVERKYKDNEGNNPVDFIDCVSFGKNAETLSKYAHKGDLIGIEGSIQKREYDDKEGKKHYITEIMVDKITFISTKKKKNQEENPYKDMSVKTEQQQQFEITDSDLPF